MDQELMKLATQAAKATVEAAVRLSPAVWKPLKHKVVGLWLGDPLATDVRQAADSLDDPETRPDALAHWAVRYAALLENRPEATGDLRTLVREIVERTNSGTNSRGDMILVVKGRRNRVIQAGDGNTFIRSGTVGASALLVMIAALVVYLVVRPDTSAAVEQPRHGGSLSTISARPPLDSCGTNLPAVAEPPDGADDPAVRQSYSYKVTSASGDGRDLRPGGSIRQAFVAGRPYINQVSAIVGVANSRPHPIEFRLQRLDGTVLMDATENETPADNNKDIVHNISPTVKVEPREMLFLTVVNRSDEQVRFFVDPPISNQVTVPYAACVTGQAQNPERHPDLRNNILSGSVQAQDLP